MCGIVGIVNRDGSIDKARLIAMRDSLEHRGPDDAGTWIDGNVGLGHRRLSIVDLSAAGHQPMTSADGRWVISYNGEVYNFESIRGSLPGRSWRGTCDSEVIVEAIAEWGFVAALQKFIGMFAFAAFDTHTRQLWLARDRLGIKPLYFGNVGERILFASELSALRGFTGSTIDHDALTTYLRFGYVPAPASILRGIGKLAPGQYVTIDTDQCSIGAAQPYWTLAEHARPQDWDETEAEEELCRLLKQTVQDRLVADVPLGAFLSGGYDSSLVCALMQEVNEQTTRTFTIGFDDKRYNEADHAKAIAEHLGTDHTELFVAESDLLQAVERLPQLCDEPFADSSILPTFLVSQLARSEVTVALSGDGGDELFWGYPRYEVTERVWRSMRRIPAPVRRATAAVAHNKHLQRLTSRIPTPAWGGRRGTLNQKIAAVGELAASNSLPETYLRLLSQYARPQDLVLNGAERTTAYAAGEHWTTRFDHYERSAWQDTLQYLPDDILTKVDRASMAVGLEARVPILDHRVVEFSASLPAALKRRDGQGKYLLKKVLNRYVPSELTDRPKMGFGVPIDTWLRGPLREWTSDLLSRERLRKQQLLHPEPIGQLLADHLDGRSNNGVKLWNILMIQVWLDAVGSNQRVSA